MYELEFHFYQACILFETLLKVAWRTLGAIQRNLNLMYTPNRNKEADKTLRPYAVVPFGEEEK